jgi:Trypsin-like serine proteases, typically periplasmic, contain C-terminal PDZ domain
MADAVERIRRSLVMVNGRQRQPASGIVVAADQVLTADHVLERDDDLTIQTDDGRTLAARLVGRDQTSDLALLRIDALGRRDRSAGARSSARRSVRACRRTPLSGRTNGEPGHCQRGPVVRYAPDAAWSSR